MADDRYPPRAARPRVYPVEGDVRVTSVRTSPIGRCRDCGNIIFLAVDTDNAMVSLSHRYPHCPAWDRDGIVVMAKRNGPDMDLALPEVP